MQKKRRFTPKKYIKFMKRLGLSMSEATGGAYLRNDLNCWRPCQGNASQRGYTCGVNKDESVMIASALVFNQTLQEAAALMSIKLFQ